MIHLPAGQWAPSCRERIASRQLTSIFQVKAERIAVLRGFISSPKPGTVRTAFVFSIALTARFAVFVWARAGICLGASLFFILRSSLFPSRDDGDFVRHPVRFSSYTDARGEAKASALLFRLLYPPYRGYGCLTRFDDALEELLGFLAL